MSRTEPPGRSPDGPFAARLSLELLESTPDAIVVVNRAGQIVLVNARSEALFGYSSAELIGQRVELLVPERLRDRHQDHRAAYVATPHLRPMGAISELLGQRKDGSEFPVEIGLSPISVDGQMLVVSAIRDITHRKETERRLQEQKQQLAHVMRVTTLGEMATGLAHEVNQPLAAIAAYARGASVRIKGGKANWDELAEVLDRIAEDAHRAAEVVRRLRQFGKQRETDRSAVDANELVQEVCRFVAAEAAHRQIVVTLKPATGLPPVLADPIEIQQVLLNLILNALDAVAPMDATCRHVVVRTRATARGTVEWIVDDSGPGISANLKEQVFEPFFTSKEQGLGMGLAISRSLVESHGGRIWTRRSKWGGASVGFSLPIMDGPQGRSLCVGGARQ